MAKNIVQVVYSPDDKTTPVRIKPSTETKQDELIRDTDISGEGDLVVGDTKEVEITFTGTTKKIRIRADVDNTGIIYIGKTGVLADGTNDFVRLEAGDEVIMNYDDSTNALYAISDTASQVLNRGATL